MDTSETYIKMCDCEEIQELWKKQLGDIIYGIYPCEVNIISESWDAATERLKERGAIWLPRQDQLQEMVCRNISPGTDLDIADMLGGFFNWYDDADTLYFTSMEQLWLGYVQKELHNKVWDGESWISASLD